jgi:DNA topoisomerase-1
MSKKVLNTSSALFIVESPSKIKTLNKILNNSEKSYLFMATLGHIRDLPAKNLGIDLKTFEPHLEVISKKRVLLSRLKKLLPSVKKVYIATDPDREGEAIGFHLFEYIQKSKSHLEIRRLELLEITEIGIKQALKNPREIDENLYTAWKARRVLDRLIGYRISPFLSRNFKKALSAGRVQSPALRLIVEREREIEGFIPEKSYSLIVAAEDEAGNLYELELFTKKELLKKQNQEEFLKIFEAYLRGKEIKLSALSEKIQKRYPPQPLKTSTLIEFSGKYLGLSPKETMKTAQKLYEEGYITYMRTDSTRISPLARREAKDFIVRHFGEGYVSRERKGRLSAFAQDAHECIRPTKVNLEAPPLGKTEKALYELIRKVFLSSQMKEAEYLERTYEFRNETLPRDLRLLMKRKKLIFDGFLLLLGEEEKETEDLLNLKEGAIFTVKDYKIREHITKPPERFTPQSLIKKMEALGIGRPSTYATMLDILFTRGYVEKEGRYLKPTELGRRVCEFLERKTPLFMDYKFTARLEESLDKISEKKRDYYSTVKEVFEILEGYLSKR